MKIGDEILIHGYIDEIRKDTIIVRNDGGYFGTVETEIRPVEQEPQTGRWIYTLEDWNRWECSECGFTKRTDVHVDLGYKYCPNCGAKMEASE